MLITIGLETSNTKQAHNKTHTPLKYLIYNPSTLIFRLSSRFTVFNLAVSQCLRVVSFLSSQSQFLAFLQFRMYNRRLSTWP